MDWSINIIAFYINFSGTNIKKFLLLLIINNYIKMKISEKILNALKHSNLSENILKQSINHKNSLISPCLISDYLESYLYTSKNSFYKKKPRIGRLNKNMNFSKMKGTADYIKELNNVYPKGKYLTASELLTPYFGYTIGNYILKSHELFHAEKPLIIVEVGCGLGILIIY